MATATIPAAHDEASPEAVHLWQAVERLIDRSPSVAALREHRLHLLAAERWRRLGKPVPAELVAAERRTALAQLAVRPLLERVRSAVDGQLLVFKGPEAAALYPRPGLRPFGDVDLLVEDALDVQRALVADGFVEIGDPRLYVGIHHLRPLAWPGLPLCLEVHQHPKWLDREAPPPFAALAEAAVPSRCGVDGVDALAPAQSAVVLAAHSWAHQPFRQLSELVDVAAVRCGVPAAEVAAVAHEWNVERLWRTVSRACDAVFLDGRPSWHLRTWARSIPRASQRTVAETHLEACLAPLGALRPLPGLRAAALAALGDARPNPSEPWTRKLRRTTLAARDAFAPRSSHDRDLSERELL